MAFDWNSHTGSFLLNQPPNTSNGSMELESAIRQIQQGLRSAPVWQFHEAYIDRGALDPFLLIKLRKPEPDKGDSALSQALFRTKFPGLSYIQRTAQQSPGYWTDMESGLLIRKLHDFKRRFDSNRFQPPGLKWNPISPKEPHQIFADKRFIYEIESPFRIIAGIGPAKFSLELGAVCGTVLSKKGLPLDGVEVRLIKGEKVMSRKTKDGGLFWFSRVPEGSYQIKLGKQAAAVQVIRRDEFGNIKGWLNDADGYPVEYADLQFKAPDGEIFMATANESGKYTTGPLPAFPVTGTPLSKYPYLLSVPGFMFSLTKSVLVRDAVIGGVLRDNSGAAISHQRVILRQKMVQVAETMTDDKGYFRFFELAGGSFQIEVPSHRIYLSTLPAGRIEGSFKKGSIPETRIELVADGKPVTTERISSGKEFVFEDVAPGRYEVLPSTDNLKSN